MNALEDDRIGTLLLHACDPMAAQLNPPVLGDVVAIVDDESDRWNATVIEVEDLWLGLEIDWSSWEPDIQLPQPTDHGAGYSAKVYESDTVGGRKLDLAS
jgi:hypothetical protein